MKLLSLRIERLLLNLRGKVERWLELGKARAGGD